VAWYVMKYNIFLCHHDVIMQLFARQTNKEKKLLHDKKKKKHVLVLDKK
jgi:hypothetical protein